MLKNDDNSVIEVDVHNDKIKKLPANINFYFQVYCNSDDLSWSVDESSYLTEGDLDVPLFSEVINDEHKKNNKEVLIPLKKLENSFSGQENLEELGIEENSNLPVAKKLKRSLDGDIPNSKIINIDEINLLDMKLKSKLREEVILNKNINKDQDINETNLISINSCKLPDLTHLTDIYGPSCSKDFCSLPGPSNYSKSLNLPNSFDAKLNDSASDENIVEDTSYLLDFFKECFLKDSIVPMAVPGDIEVTQLEECDYFKFKEKSLGLENDNENSDQEESNDFIEDSDVVNSEIIYNIDLNEHYKQMDILVQKISETPDNLTVLHECMRLPPIPQIEHQQKTFSTEERLMFKNGCSKYDYQIDRDDWTKIMVKRAVIFTAHAGFNIANEESLYVLADVMIDYIKRIAVIMKKYFDIQSNCSYPTSVDPINLTLQEIGVEGGIRELLQHYKNDVFDRRDKLINKCQHLQKIIDQYIERMKLDNSIINHYVTNEDFTDETIPSEIILQNNENVPLPDNNETESVVEVNAEFRSLLEENQNEIQSTTEENIANTELKLTEPVFIDNISDMEPKMDNNLKNIISITDDSMEIRDRKINNIKTVNTKIMDIDLLKPLTFSADNDIITNENRLCENECFTKLDKEKILKMWKPSCESYSERKKKRKLLDRTEVEQMMVNLYPDIYPRAPKEMSELEKGFEIFKKTLLERKKASKNARSSKKKKKKAEDNLTSNQTIIFSSDSDRKKAIILDSNNTNHNFPDNNLNVSDND